MTRAEMIVRVSAIARKTLVKGCYVESDNGEPWSGVDFCYEHADMAARVEALESGVACWVATASMGEDGHRECAFGGCGKHLDFGCLTDYGINSALGLTETDPRACSVYPSELELSARAMNDNDPRWELWEFHAEHILSARAAKVTP